ncbi:MAG: hypothetical protein ABR582_13620 [Gemmatimonadaceae bacterium]
MFDDADDLIPISGLFYDDDGPHIVAEEEYLIPISQLFFEDDGPHVVATQPAPPRFTPARGLELQNLIGTTIAQLGAVSGGTRRTPTPLPPPVPIESLLYRGRAALERALEIRSSRGPGELPAPEAIEELLDLIALAVEE